MSRNRGLMLALLGIFVISALSALAYRLPGPRGSASADPVPADGFSAYRAQAQLKALVGDGVSHPIGSTANARVRGVIVRRLVELGYQTQIQSGFVCNLYATCGTPSNIIARLPPRQQGGDAAEDADLVLLAAHYDSVPAGPGASDDGAGVAALLEIARALTVLPPSRHPVALLITDGEEAGLLGALLFVRDEPLAQRVAAAVNLEARGSSGPSLMFETGSANAWLMNLYRIAIARPITDSVYYDAYRALPNSTDFTVFKAAQWQGFNFAFIGDVGHYHTGLDNFENADLRSIQHQGDNALASVLVLADSDALRARPADQAVYFDVLSRLLVVWPARYSSMASCTLFAVLLIEAALLLRLRRVRLRQIGWGALGALACLVLGGTASAGALVLLLKTGKVPPLGQYSWIAHPVWMNLTCAALAACAAAASSVWFVRHAGFWGFWLGAVLLVAVQAGIEAALWPGTSFIALLTAAAAAIAVLPSLITKGSPAWTMTSAALAPAWTMFALTVPLISLLYAAIGSTAWIMDTLLLSLCATLLLPLLAAASSALRHRILALAASVGVAGVAITLALPTYSAAWPQRLNFRYRLNSNEHAAVWIAEPDSMRLPAYVARAVHFARGRTAAFEAPAPAGDLPPPRLTLRFTDAAAGATRYHLHLQSPRGAPEIDLSFPERAQIREIILDDAPGGRRVPLFETSKGMTRIHLVGLAPEGLDFAVDVAGDSLEAHLSDQSYALWGGDFLRRLRPPEATSSQDGDTTIVQNTVTLDPAAGR